MKTTTIPAQITTVEDKIAGNLNLAQMLLLCAPIFIGGALYVIFPPILKESFIKLLLFIFSVIVFSILSIRIKGKVLLAWLSVICRYNLRPRYYIYSKNEAHLRSVNNVDHNGAKATEVIKAKPALTKLHVLPIPKIIQLQSAITDPRANLSFRTNRKGRLSVYITEIK